MAQETIGQGRFQATIETGGIDSLADSFLDAVAIFGQTYTLGNEAKAEVARREAEFEFEMEQARKENERADAEIQVKQDRETRLTAQGEADITQAQLEETGKNTRAAATETGLFQRAKARFEHEKALKKIPTGNQDRTSNEAALKRGAALRKFYLDEGLIEPDDLESLNEIFFFGSLDPDQQSQFLQFRDEEEEKLREENFQTRTIPQLQQQQFPALVDNPAVDERLKQVEASGEPGTVEQIQGVPPEVLFGDKDQIPPVFAHPPTFENPNILRQDQEGAFIANPRFREAVEFLNRQSKAATDEQRKAVDSQRQRPTRVRKPLRPSRKQ